MVVKGVSRAREYCFLSRLFRRDNCCNEVGEMGGLNSLWFSALLTAQARSFRDGIAAPDVCTTTWCVGKPWYRLMPCLNLYLGLNIFW